MAVENCKKCGGTHVGSYDCPFTDGQIARMKTVALPPLTADQEAYLKKIGGYMTAEEIAAAKIRIG